MASVVLAEEGVVILEIPAATPSLNETAHKHWTVVYRMRKRWKRLVRDSIYTGGHIPIAPQPPPYAVLRIERFGPRLLDHDNAVGGCKPLIDALKDFRLIADDSPEHVLVEFAAYVHKLPHTRVTITPKP